jgi:hypothetical protein
MSTHVSLRGRDVRRGHVLAGCLALAAVLAGCSTSGSTSPSASGPTTPAPTSESPSPTDTASPSETSESASPTSDSATPSDTSTTSASATASSSPATTTVLTFQVTGCDGCTLVLARAPTPTNQKQLGSATVRNGTATISLRTRDTVAMSIQVVHPQHYGAGNAAPVVVMNYGAVGVSLTPDQARAQRVGYYCWAGTTKAAATLRLRTALSGPFPAPDYWALAVYADPALPSWPGEQPHQTFHGALGTQDLPYCHD